MNVKDKSLREIRVLLYNFFARGKLWHKTRMMDLLPGDTFTLDGDYSIQYHATSYPYINSNGIAQIEVDSDRTVNKNGRTEEPQPA
jgi:hypothetical protein